MDDVCSAADIIIIGELLVVDPRVVMAVDADVQGVPLAHAVVPVGMCHDGVLARRQVLAAESVALLVLRQPLVDVSV